MKNLEQWEHQKITNKKLMEQGCYTGKPQHVTYLDVLQRT